MGHILLCPNPHSDTGLRETARAAQMLRAAGQEVKVSPILTAGADTGWPETLRTEPLADALPGARLLVTLGGDGTIMHAARAALGMNIPILGVNLGHVGFMTDIEQGEEALLLEAAAGRYTLQRRMMLDVQLFREGKRVFADSALNDAVVRGEISAIHLKAFGDGVLMSEFSGDGVIVSSPTGATAYSMSAGGPLVEPDAENIILTPICPHWLSARSFVLAPDRTVTVCTVEQGEKKALLSVDGGNMELLCGDRLVVGRSRYVTYMAHVSSRSFYDVAYKKLSARNR